MKHTTCTSSHKVFDQDQNEAQNQDQDQVQAQEPTDFEKCKSSASSGSSEWEELMGKDLTMKIIDREEDMFLDREVDGDFVTSENSKLQKLGEIGDYMLVDFDGFYCPDSVEAEAEAETETIPTDKDVNSNTNTRTYDEDTTDATKIQSLPLSLIHSSDVITEQMKHRIPNEKKFVKFIHATDWIVKLGNGEISQGLELTLRFLPLGKCAIVQCHSKYAYPHGRLNNCTATISRSDTSQSRSQLQSHSFQKCNLDLPPNTSVIYRVYLRAIKPFDEVHANNYFFRLKLAKQLKLIGNDAYQHELGATCSSEPGAVNALGKVRCLKAYNDTTQELISLCTDLSAMEHEDEHDQGVKQNQHLSSSSLLGTAPIPTRKEVLSLLVDCYNNIAAVYLRSKEYTQAKDAAVEAIKLDPNNIKALCRGARASMMSGSYEECKVALDVALALDHHNRDVQRLKVEFERRRNIYRRKEKAMYTKMMMMQSGSTTTNHDNMYSSSVGDGIKQTQGGIVPKADDSPSQKIGFKTTKDKQSVRSDEGELIEKKMKKTLPNNAVFSDDDVIPMNVNSLIKNDGHLRYSVVVALLPIVVSIIILHKWL